MRKRRKKLNNFFSDQTILITGGTGSIGTKIVEHLINTRVQKIIIYSRDEYKQQVLREKFDDDRIRYFIGDVRDGERLLRACKGVDYVIHTAAQKQVPACEYNPIEAIKTNINGAINVVNASIENNVKKVIALSTDKAVNPINLYGATKLCSDKLFINANAYSKNTSFSIVRYGNVAGSRGSVIPFFEDLICKGTKRLPLTHEDMTRFHITYDQAIDLIFFALFNSHGGEIFVAKIPSFKVGDLIKNCFQLEYDVVGIRQGEKLHEIMITKEDAQRTKEFDKYYIIYPEFEWHNMSKGGEPVADGFSYESNNNKDWLYESI